MGKVLDLYRMQIDVLWNWSGGRVALVKRLLITLVVATIAFAATARLLRSVTVDSVAAAFAAVVLMALFNAVIRVGVPLIAPYSPVVTGSSLCSCACLPARRERRAGGAPERRPERAGRVARVRGDQHGADRDPRHRPERLLLRAPSCRRC